MTHMKSPSAGDVLPRVASIIAMSIYEELGRNDSLDPEQQLTTIKKALAQFERRCGEISDQQAAIEADVHKSFRQLWEMLGVRETEVICQLHQLKLKSLAEGPDRDPPGQARQLYRLREGSRALRQAGRQRC